MRRVLFWVTAALMLPLFTFGYLLLLVTGMPRVRKAGISATAVAPLSARWIFDAVGNRPDPACRALLLNLPIVHPLAIRLCMLPVVLGVRVSGYVPFFARYPIDTPQNLWELIGQRNTFFDRAIEDAAGHCTQFVHLGAGFDTRTHRLPAAACHRVFEVDRAPIQRLKREALDGVGIDHGHIRYVEVDFGDPGWWSSVETAGFDQSQPTFFLWEGVSYYLQEQDVVRMLSGVAQRSPVGSRVAFDYASNALISGEGGPLMGFARLMLRLSREPWTWCLDTQAGSADPAKALVQRCGLALQTHSPYGQDTPNSRPVGGLAVAEVAAPLRPVS